MALKRNYVNPSRKVGRNLRRERLRLGLTQAAVAQRSGLSAGTISALEQGKRPHALITTLARIAGGLGIRCSKLFVGC
jgi:transcriptional regulator with XRE-family HTH domain